LGEDGPNRWASSVSNGDAVMGGSWLTHGVGPGISAVFGKRGENGLRLLFDF
jgi:hypothetical protein